MRTILMLSLVLGATAAQAQDSGRTGTSPGSAQLSSLAAFLVPTVVGIGVILPENASDGQVGVGSALFFAGAILGPAVGYWRGGSSGRGWLGVGIRAGVTAAAFASVADSDDIGAASTAAVGVFALVAHAVYDVVRVKSITTARQSRVRLGVSPDWVTGSGFGLRVEW